MTVSDTPKYGDKNKEGMIMAKYDKNKKHAYFNGITFTRDEKTGYYLSTRKVKDGKRQRLHVYVWEYYNGEIPKGYEIHHKDENKGNNESSNFELVTGPKHRRIHADEFLHDKKRIEESTRYLLELAQPKAKEWHRSKEGRKWHKKHYEKFKDKLQQKREFKCRNCGKTFLSVREGFCSNNCKSAWRRKQGLDNENRICVICGKEFETNKYSKVKTCSITCGRKLRCLTMRKSKK